MGVISITHRSASLGNLGGVQMARTNTGAAEMWGSAAKLGNGLMDLGRAGVGIAAMLRDRDDQKKTDEFYNRYTAAMDRYNVSFADDGTPQGAMQRPFEDGSVWLKDNDEYRRQLFDHIAGNDENGLNLNERQKELARRRIAEFDRSLDRMWTDKANAVYVANETKAATDAFERTSALVTTDPTQENLTDWRKAGERLMAIKGITKSELKDAFWRDASLKALKDGEAVEFAQMAAQAEEAGGDGEKVWDELIEKTEHSEYVQWGEKDGKIVFKSPAAHLSDDDLSRYHDEWTKRAKAAKAEWLRGMKAATDKAYESARADITAIPAPNPSDTASVRDYEKRVGQMYDGLLYETKADGKRELTEFGARLKAYAPLKFASANACICAHAKKYDAARVQTNGIMLLDMLDSGVEDEMYAGGRRMLNSSEKIHLAEFLMAHNDISKSDYHAALKRIGEQEEPLAVEFWNTISKSWSSDFLKTTTWKADLLEYAFKDTESARKFSSKDSKYEHEYVNDTGDEVEEKMLYSQVMQAARIAVQRMIGGRKRGETDEQALKRAVDDFNRMTSDTQEGIMRLNYKRRFAAENARLDNLRNQRRENFTGRFPAQFDVQKSTREDITEKENN